MAIERESGIPLPLNFEKEQTKLKAKFYGKINWILIFFVRVSKLLKWFLRTIIIDVLRLNVNC